MSLRDRPVVALGGARDDLPMQLVAFVATRPAGGAGWLGVCHVGTPGDRPSEASGCRYETGRCERLLTRMGANTSGHPQATVPPIVISLLMTAELASERVSGFEQFCALLSGDRAADRALWLRRIGITRMAAWHTPGPAPQAVLLFEGTDPLHALQHAEPDETFGNWFLAELDLLLPEGEDWVQRLAAASTAPLVDTSPGRHSWRTHEDSAF